MERITELHESLTKHTELIHSSNTKLSNCISMHFSGNPLSLLQLGRFLDESSKAVRNRAAYNIGSMAGNLIVSVKLNATSTPAGPPNGNGSSILKPSSSKRGYDDSYDRARDAVNAARKRLQKSNTVNSVSDEHLEFAQSIIGNMFRELKGANGELIIESLGLSVTPSTVIKQNAFQTGNVSGSEPANFSTKPRLIVACRLSGGVAIPAFTLRRVLSHPNSSQFFDGMLTTKVDSLGPEYRMPLSDLGKEAESKGQPSMLLFVAVPLPSQPSQKRSAGTDHHHNNNSNNNNNDNNNDEDDTNRPSKAARRM